jgi:predicted permease
MIAADVFFNSAGLNTTGELPLWLYVAFTIMALVVFVIVAWFLTQKVRDKIPVKRERAYAGFLIALIVSGLIDDGLKGLISLLFHARSIRIMIPLYILSYVVLLAVLAFILKKSTASSAEASQP